MQTASPVSQESTRAGALRSVLHPVVVILMLAGIVERLSGNPVHAAFLCAVSVALAADGLLTRGRPLDEVDTSDAGDRLDGLTGPRRRLSPLGVIGAAASAIVIGQFPRFSWPLTLAVAVPAGIVVALAWPKPNPQRPVPAPIERGGGAAWASVFIVLGLWELTALLLQPSFTTNSRAHPTLSHLADPMLASHVGRSIGLLVWVLLGWALVRE